MPFAAKYRLDSKFRSFCDTNNYVVIPRPRCGARRPTGGRVANDVALGGHASILVTKGIISEMFSAIGGVPVFLETPARCKLYSSRRCGHRFGPRRAAQSVLNGVGDIGRVVGMGEYCDPRMYSFQKLRVGSSDEPSSPLTATTTFLCTYSTNCLSPTTLLSPFLHLRHASQLFQVG